jgi:hypothetical protein
MTDAFMIDRVMSLHHRAFEFIQVGKDHNAFCEYLGILADRDNDASLREETTTKQIWDTALAAVESGVSKHQAFPLTAEQPNGIT